MTSPRRAAFTLLEMLAVVFIIGMLAVMVVPNLGIGARVCRDQAHALAADLEFARQRTVMTGIPHRVVLDLNAGSWWVEWQAPPAPPPKKDVPDPRPRDGGPVDLTPPARPDGAFVPLPSGAGRAGTLQHGVRIGSVKTEAGVVEKDQVSVTFARDGSVDPTQVTLLDDKGDGFVLDIRALADAVVVRHAG